MKKLTSSLVYSLLFVSMVNGQFKYSSYIPVSRETKLDSSSIQQMTSLQLKLIKNEIFANHGYIFNTVEMKLHFGSCLWYEPKFKNVNHLLTDIEKYNLNLIADFKETGFLDISEINKTGKIFTDSYFEGNERSYYSKSVTYEEIFSRSKTERKSYIVQKVREYAINKDIPVDAPAFYLQTFNFFTFNNNGKLEFYKTLKVKEGKVKIKSINNRLFYEAKTHVTGIAVFKLVDIDDGFPFVISNRDDQFFELKTKENTRWISYYEYAQDDWIYDQKSDYIEIDSVRYQRLGSILYSDLDYIYQIIDIYWPRRQSNWIYGSESSRISLKADSDKEKFRFGFDNKKVFLDDFINFVIEFQIFDHSYILPVVQDKIDVSKFKDQGDGLILKVREFE